MDHRLSVHPGIFQFRFSSSNTCFIAVNMCGEHNFYLELLLMPAASALDIEKSVEETILNGDAESLKPR